jgi:hypothetical protein
MIPQKNNKEWYQSTNWLSQVHPNHIAGYILKKVASLSPVVAYNRVTELTSLVQGSRLQLFIQVDEPNFSGNECIPFRIDGRTIREIENLRDSYLEGRNEFLKEKDKNSLERAIKKIETGNLEKINISRYANWLTKKLDFRERRREYNVPMLGKPNKNNRYDYLEIEEESEFDNNIKERLAKYHSKLLKGGSK